MFQLPPDSVSCKLLMQQYISEERQAPTPFSFHQRPSRESYLACCVFLNIRVPPFFHERVHSAPSHPLCLSVAFSAQIEDFELESRVQRLSWLVKVWWLRKRTSSGDGDQGHEEYHGQHRGKCRV